jgi:NitT/TauT family transport system substrate-binding protein
LTLADLPRLKLATVSEVPTPWLCLQQDLRRIGIDPERLERVTTHAMPANLEALRNGELDVAQMFEPYVSMALQRGIGKVLYAASTRGPTVYTTFLATRRATAAPLPPWFGRCAACRHGFTNTAPTILPRSLHLSTQT